MPTGNNADFRIRWLKNYHRLGHSIAVLPGIVIAYFAGMFFVDFSVIAILVIIFGVEICAISGSWVATKFGQQDN